MANGAQIRNLHAEHGQLPSIHIIPIHQNGSLEDKDELRGRTQGRSADDRRSNTPRRPQLHGPSSTLTPRQAATLPEGEVIDFTTPRVRVTTGSK